MKKKDVALFFDLQCNDTCVPLLIGTGKLKTLPNEGDVLVLNAELAKPIFLKVLKIEFLENSSVQIDVQYFGAKEVLKRASESKASIFPVSEIKPRYDGVALCMLYAE